jgi:uncharacterized protein YqgC (DUF456 family)
MFTVLLWVLGVLLILTGLVGTLAPALPGPAFVYLGIVCVGWAGQFQVLSPVFLLVLGFLTALLLAVDYVASAIGTARFGGTRWGVLGAALGAFAGLFFLPLGLVLGPLAGAIGAELLAGRSTEEAARAGWGSFLGFLGGTVVKVVTCLAMVLATVVAHLV